MSAVQIENVTTPRPMTHDLLRNVIHDLKAEIRKGRLAARNAIEPEERIETLRAEIDGEDL